MTFERSPQLNSESVSVYQQQGFLLLPAYFSQDEIFAVKSCLPHILSARTERTIFEPDGHTVRSVYGVHKDCELVARLSRHPLLVSAARQLLGGEVYLYQSKLNLKPAFAGTAWDWHQDYTYWHNEDAMPAPRAVNIAVFLDDVSEFNGPLYFVPGSQQDGIHQHSELIGQPEGYEQAPEWISNLTAKLKYVIERDRLTELVRRHGITAAKGPAGSVLVFHSNIVHASPPNITPLERSTLLFSYNHISNAPPEALRRRPDFLSSADTHPIQEAEEDLSHLLSCTVARPLSRGNHEQH